jgi:hypothetical protein
MSSEPCLFGGPYGNDLGVVERLANTVSSVDSLFDTDKDSSLTDLTFISTNPPKSTSFGSFCMSMPPSGDNQVPPASYSIERPFHDASPKLHAPGSGLLLSSLRAPNSARHHKVTGTTIKKKRGRPGRSRMLEAMNLLEKLKDVLESDSQFTNPINQLQEAVGEELLHETRTFRPGSESVQGENDSGYHSGFNSAYRGDTASISRTSEASFKSQHDGSMAFLPSDMSISEQDFTDTAMGMEISPVLGSLHPMIPLYHCTFSSNRKLCNFSTRSKCDWVRHEESKKHWPRKQYMFLLCIEPLDDELGAAMCSFCFIRVSATGNNKAHYLQCEKARLGKHCFAGARNDHFRDHLRKHGMTSISQEALTWTFATEENWPR